MTKQQWLPYFELVGIDSPLAFELMPVVGLVDIFLDLWLLLDPRPALLLYMAIWAVWTALLRPLTGEGWWEFLERAGNYGVPISLLILSGPVRTAAGWWERIRILPLEGCRAEGTAIVLRLTAGMLLIGHGVLAMNASSYFIQHLQALFVVSIVADLPHLVPGLGWFEILLGGFVAIRPMRSVLIFVVAWKVATELLYPFSQAAVWEFIERFGSYGAPLALLYLLPATWEADPAHDVSSRR